MSQGRDEPRDVRPPRNRATPFLWIGSCLLHVVALWLISLQIDVRLPRGPEAGAGGVVQAVFLDGAGDGGERNVIGSTDTGEVDSAVVSIAASESVEFELQPETVQAAFEADEVDRTRPRQANVNPYRDEPPDRSAAGTAPADDLAAIFEPRAGRAPGAADRTQFDLPRRRNSFVRPAAKGSAGRRPGSGKGRGATPATSFFGLRGEGRRFVYLIDCSSSMARLGALDSAVDELLASLALLPATVRVQVVFYNEKLHAYEPLDRSPGLVRNTERERNRIEHFARGFTPDGGTSHFDALTLALQWEPDAVFLLSDAGEPHLTHREINVLQQRNRSKAQIHVVEFGSGPWLEEQAWLSRLARSSSGGYGYCDLAELPTAAEAGP